LHFSVLLAVLSFGAWLKRDWWVTGLAIVPSLLGFSVATFAVFVAIGDEKFRVVLAKGGMAKVEALLDIYSSFIVLIFVQVFSLLYSAVASSRPLSTLFGALSLGFDDIPGCLHWVLIFLSYLFRFMGWVAILYSVIALVPMSLSVFRMARLYLLHLFRAAGSSGNTGGAGCSDKAK